MNISIFCQPAICPCIIQQMDRSHLDVCNRAKGDSITAHNTSRANYYFLAPSAAHSTPLIKAPAVERKTKSTPLNPSFSVCG